MSMDVRKMRFQFCFISVVLAVWLPLTITDRGVLGLRDLRMEVPESVRLGESVRLACLFDLEDDVLDSIKWYKDKVEFYRFKASSSPFIMYFPIPDIDVDISRSLNGTVYLMQVERSVAGIYRCEVAVDAPSFDLLYGEVSIAVENPPVDNHTGGY